MDDRTLIDRIAALSAELGAAVAERLARLADLETDFQAALEIAKLDALKELAYGASHEINNPLANISARAQTLLQDERDPERRRRLAAINSQAFRAHEMIADLMLFARPPRMERKPVDLAALVSGIVDEISEAAASQNTHLLADLAEKPLSANVDPIHLRVAIKALTTNSLEALGGGGRIEIQVRRAALKSESQAPGEAIEILVTDTGPGIPAAVRPHIFDPFYSGREAGRGLGMGLPKCWRIVREHAGQLALESSDHGGATFRILLPAAHG